MNILITGANGLLGKNLINILSSEHTIFALIKEENKILFDNNNVHTIAMDLSHFDTNKLPSDIDVIYYFAQSNRFREFPDGARDMLEININAPLQLAEWARQNNVKKFIYASSGGVYTNPDKPVKEFFDINANEKQGFYLNSKLCAEMLLKNYANFFETFVVIRPFFIYGIGQNETMLIPRLIKNVKEGKEIQLSGKSGININPIYVGDAAQSVARLLDIKGEHLFNIAGNDIVSIKEIGELIGKILDKEAKFQFLNNPQTDLIADNSMMRKWLAEPVVTIQEGLMLMVESL